MKFSDFLGDSRSGSRGSSRFKSFPSLGSSSNWNLAVNQLSVIVVTVIVAEQLTPEIKIRNGL